MTKGFTEGFLHERCPYFDIVFAQLGVIPTARNKAQFKSNESKKRPFRTHLSVIIRLSLWKNVNKKGRNFLRT